MKKIICFVLTIIFILSVAGCSTPSVDEKSLTVGIKPSEVERKNFDGDFTKIYADFAVESFKNFYDKENNSVICPVSVMLALSMAANGAEGETLEEMKNVLTDGMEIDALNENLYVMSKYLTEGDNSMDIAKSVWIRDEEIQIQVNEEFLQTAVDYYKAQVFKEPFNQQTVTDINNWVKEKTEGMIKGIIDSIENDVIMYLINAVTFDAEWEKIYFNTDIIDKTFYNSDGSQTEREFMRSDEWKHIRYKGSEGFIKDYKDEKFSFVALLPPANMKIDEFIQSMDGASLTDALENYQEKSFTAYMPKFSCEYEIELKEPLINMGMERAFDSGNAQFEKMCVSTSGNVYIGRVLHKTFICVDEKGTKAGAATAVEIKNEMAAEMTGEIVLDRPFVYLIIDNETGIPLFMGQILNLN